MSINLCKYSNIFGKPGEGVHKYRIFGLAIVDLVSTIIVAYLIHYFVGWKLWKVIVVLFILGIIMHRLFCVRTAVDKLLFS